MTLLLTGGTPMTTRVGEDFGASKGLDSNHQVESALGHMGDKAFFGPFADFDDAPLGIEFFLDGEHLQNSIVDHRFPPVSHLFPILNSAISSYFMQYHPFSDTPICCNS